ncbi:sugar ABC transporter ATP-binding protein [Limimaricola cinnabarinus]|uniref:Ribose ABC transport system, ATP-binding protein RbsA n=1 Tax=Limimaricola cinnabarinus LL-001 TaxID=1337093 RepID=U3ACE6_9RHOB|nr:sugar ABC transporter ATP-binding protein [Limimaricola cinnabarinus]GAD55319.1 ribose ABC transport system, ATP-binding protein RbsA [Limimaricola cinnabarinus LL-001]
MANLLELRDVDKSFATIPVLRHASFALRPGEVHALMGGNGAGKSTLMKILTGVYTKDGGSLVFDGEAVELAGPRDAERLGIAMIFQEFSLIPTLSVAQNIFLHHEPRTGGFLNDAEAERRAAKILRDLGEDIDPRAIVETLSVGACQMVEIAKALSKNARVLIMDEPTSSLSESEARTLFGLVRKLKSEGISIVYISHRMAEIFEICDRITVMRDGHDALTRPTGEVTMQQLIEAMLGEGVEAAMQYHARRLPEDAPTVLEVEALTLEEKVSDASFEIRAGEIVGLAGLTASGRTEIAEAIFGLRRIRSGEVRIDGKPVRGTDQAIAAGVALVPENRRTQGLVLEHSMHDNLILPNLGRFTRGMFVRDGAGRRAANDAIARLKIRTDGPDKIVGLLSGGNQQKIVLAKWLERRPRLLILDEPTIGVDIGAKSDLVEIIREIADAGTAVMVISSEFEELLAMSDRVLVLHDGRLIKELKREDIATEEVLHHAIQG